MKAVSTKDVLAQMARYHAWATEGLLSSIAQIPDEPYAKPCGLFFGSIHGTLNHLLLTDSQIWFPRFKSEPITSLPLDAELESDRVNLASRLIAATARWPDYVASLDEPTLADDLRYTMTTGQPRALPMTAALQHVFNHATHHRGQITAAISMLGFEFQPLDLPYLVFSELA
ncbi:MAG: DinB family protein [Phenylobacterium sp.]|uniref:DinB family protein n=1 Tax=Phenylobacterium sp. TaxID=1871053 RepID=UPI0025DC433A|nr:DinB family protein [Phenylobacterium sp.]MCA3738107.1 DinB family protein [Phenylobacterium sp.]MCA4915009.1 DinB family protein [Phenylobacterium sp.]MCA6230512.1 DinB family protein [Phenylobacterium sp.]MCA6247695.1 DinB family protein [Phenylobacterium sp.]MCA6254514.1 DinB family protein [Phenylobacterium sp.]